MKFEKKIELDKDFSSIEAAKAFARGVLKEHAVEANDTGFIMMDGPTICDLFILTNKVTAKSVTADVRACTDEEWGSWFNKYIVNKCAIGK